ncbi:DUF805 domain-containing protein [Oenococcus oeni]|uniref:DUF805 domain-containing protein n=2 Tax=Oenococcus oeni TaxID=1247 RepID=UPI00050E69E4|nr:DUF805 domain-containing protein [Oenococcus oeni]KGO16774.1 transporter [Oenococcus oeni X2L]KGH56751.1 transporter [Oenococcus oeni S22]KGH79674.1 transporter [Oenococcus oeni IOEB_0607]KGH90175.1 transporter [Oenococcus oeni IOEB_L26_1]KMQ38941.1 transporter [Oenococcus oeni]
MLNDYKKYWKNYFNFKDSSSRSDYWWLILANVIIFTILLIFSIIAIIAVFPSFLEAISGSSIASKSSSNSSSVWIFGSLLIAVILFVFANIIPAISLGVRRVRDTGLSPWWYLISVLATILYYLEQSTKQSWLSGLSIILQIIMLVIFLFPTKYFHKNK